MCVALKNVKVETAGCLCVRVILYVCIHHCFIGRDNRHSEGIEKPSLQRRGFEEREADVGEIC